MGFLSPIIDDFKKANFAIKVFFVAIILSVLLFALVHMGVIKLPGARAVDCTGVYSHEIIVDIVQDKFVPTRVDAHVCDTLTITNQDMHPHWPAVGPHPTHTSYPGFDAGHPLNLGESFKLLLNRPGTYSFHDHLNDDITASITISKPK